jgi:quinol-cytochrome oxidoreductase complex cytochrome b subunit
MIIVLERGAPPEQIQAVVDALQRRGLELRRLDHEGRALLHVVSGAPARARKVRRMEGVEALVPTSGPRYRREGQHFYPHHVIRWSALAMVLLGLLTFLAGQWPPGIGAPIDVQAPPPHPVVPWYARAPLAFVALFPAHLTWLGWLVFACLVFAFVFAPKLDRGRARPLWVAAGVLALAAAVFAIVRGGAA